MKLMPNRSHPETGTPPAHHRPTDGPGEGSLADERKRLMETVLNSLPARHREILMRFYLGEQSQDQICAEMGLTETQFRLLKSRAKARFMEFGRKALPRRRPPIKAVASKGTPTESAVVDIDRIVPIVAHAVAVFGDEQKASHWLARPLPLLGGRSPAQILAHGDIEAIDQILTRIEYNIPS
jgi:uncharacterized protein (DUF2384 family)